MLGRCRVRPGTATRREVAAGSTRVNAGLRYACVRPGGWSAAGAGVFVAVMAACLLAASACQDSTPPAATPIPTATAPSVASAAPTAPAPTAPAPAPTVIATPTEAPAPSATPTRIPTAAVPVITTDTNGQCGACHTDAYALQELASAPLIQEASELASGEG